MKIIDVEDDKNTCAYFEALCKTIHGKYSSDSFQVVRVNFLKIILYLIILYFSNCLTKLIFII